MSMSLDGYIAGPNDEPGNPGGDGFDRLHEWGATAYPDRPSGPAGELIDEMNATGATYPLVSYVADGIAGAMAQAKAAPSRDEH